MPEPSRPPLGISVVVPVYNERENVAPLHQRLVSVVAGLGRPHEIIYVDDGSRDGSADALQRLAETNPSVTVVVLARNFGQTAALAAGIDRARHDVVVTLDADLQNEPGDIPRLMEAIDAGADVVSGWRRRRQDPFVSRILPSLLANSLISRTTGLVLHDFGCTLKAYRRKLFDSFRLYGEMHRFLPIYAAGAGAKVVEIEVTHAPRRAGLSKYGLSRTWKVFLDLLTAKFLLSYATKPIHVFGSVGIVSCLLGVLAGGTTLVQRWMDPEAFVHRNPLILLAVFLFLLGVQSIMLGLLAEIGIRTWHETRGGRAYVVDRVVVGGQVLADSGAEDAVRRRRP